MNLFLDLGTAAIVGFGALLIVIRMRYFETHGKAALMTASVYILFVGLTRFYFTTWPDVLPPGYNRLVNGTAALIACGIQVLHLFEAEMTIRYRKRRRVRA